MHRINGAGIVYAARANMLNDATDTFALLLEISNQLGAAGPCAGLGEGDEDPATRPAKAPRKPSRKKTKRKEFARVQPETQQQHWHDAEPHLQVVQDQHSRRSFAQLLADGFLRDIARRGHGAKMSRRFDFEAFMEYLCNAQEGVARQTIQKKLAVSKYVHTYICMCIHTLIQRAYSAAAAPARTYLLRPQRGLYYRRLTYLLTYSEACTAAGRLRSRNPYLLAIYRM